MIKKILTVLLLLTILPVSSVSAQSSPLGSERTTEYNTTVEILSSSLLRITEDIEVVATGLTIKHGIFRDIPTSYDSIKGYKKKIAFDIISVTKDGIPETYKIENIEDGKRIYLGKADVLLKEGKYRYKIVYEVSGLIGFFKDYDELYFNLLPSGWAYSVEKSSSKIIFPTTINHELLKTEVYSGIFGSTNQSNTKVSINDLNGKTNISVVTLSLLNPNESVTILTHFPKGLITESTTTLNDWAIKNDGQNYVLLIGFILLILLSFFFYHKFGKDPIVKIPYPRFDLDPTISPIRARALIKENFDFKGLTAEIVDYGIKGYLSIDEDKTGIIFKESEYTINRTDKTNNSESENIFLNTLFKFGLTLKFKKSNYVKVQSVVTSVQKKIDKFINDKIHKNTGLRTITVLLGCFIIFIASMIPERQESVGIMLYYFFIFIFSLFSGLLIYYIFQKFSKTYISINPMKGILYIITFLGLLSILGLCSLSSISYGNLGILELSLIVIPALILGIIIPTYKNYTKEGLELINYVKGLQMFVTATETERVRVMGSKYTKDLSTFNKYYPYAIAFDAESNWTNDFKEVIEKAMNQSDNINNPAFIWLGGNINMVNNLNSLGGNISSTLRASSIDPTSSSHGFSGGGGGGSSGGGGGGGGGGGW